MKSEKFEFENSLGIKLSGRLELPDGQIKAYAIFAHCFTCTKNIMAASKIAKSLAANGIAVLRFDFTGLGNSEGDFSNTNFSSNLDDLISAYDSLGKSKEFPKLIIGHSLGGAAVLKASLALEEVKAVVTIGAPSDIKHVSHLFKNDLEQINETGEAVVSLAGREFKIKKQFIQDLEEQTLLSDLAKSKKSYLIMHSPIDDTVSIEHAAKIYGALKHPKSFISLNDADHLVSRSEDAIYLSNIINAWSDKYI